MKIAERKKKAVSVKLQYVFNFTCSTIVMATGTMSLPTKMDQEAIDRIKFLHI